MKEFGDVVLFVACCSVKLVFCLTFFVFVVWKFFNTKDIVLISIEYSFCFSIEKKRKI